MSVIIQHIKFSCSAATVWQYIIDPEMRYDWQPGFIYWNSVKSNYPEKGAVLRILFLLKGREIEWREELIKIVPCQLVELKFSNKKTTALIVIQIKENEGGCALQVCIMINRKASLLALLNGVFWDSFIEKKVLESAAALKLILNS